MKEQIGIEEFLELHRQDEDWFISPCPNCGTTKSTLEAQNAHEAICCASDDDDEPLYFCKYCGCPFLTESECREHEIEYDHDPNDEEPGDRKEAGNQVGQNF